MIWPAATAASTRFASAFFKALTQLGGLDAEILGRVVDLTGLAVFLLRAAGRSDRRGAAGGHRQAATPVATILRFIQLLPSKSGHAHSALVAGRGWVDAKSSL